MSKYTLTIEGDFQRGECEKCPMLQVQVGGGYEPADFCVLGGESENCLLEEVKQGEWIDKGSLSCRCSECGCKTTKETRICSACGAIMKGGK